MFIIPSGHYEYLAMHFGLRNAPVVFQHFINETLQETLNPYTFVYLNDILIFRNSLKERVFHVHQVLRLLLQSHLYVKLEKSQFYLTTISFLGQRPKRPQPTLVQLVQWFLGFTNFFFVKNFSTLKNGQCSVLVFHLVPSRSP